MCRILRFLLCYLLSCGALYFSVRNLTNDISESLAVATFLASALVLSVIIWIVWEIHLSFKRKTEGLSKRIEKLEAEKKED